MSYCSPRKRRSNSIRTSSPWRSSTYISSCFSHNSIRSQPQRQSAPSPWIHAWQQTEFRLHTGSGVHQAGSCGIGLKMRIVRFLRSGGMGATWCLQVINKSLKWFVHNSQVGAHKCVFTSTHKYEAICAHTNRINIHISCTYFELQLHRCDNVRFQIASLG